MINKIAITKFKAHCLKLIEQLQADHQDIVITKRDKPIARVVPFDNQKASLVGMLKDKAAIKGDIVAKIDEKWEAQL